MYCNLPGHLASLEYVVPLSFSNPVTAPLLPAFTARAADLVVIDAAVFMSWFDSITLQIDLATFLTLNDDDLKELGITTFGARRKMLLSIAGW